MGSLGWQELLIVLVIVIIIFGAGKITDVGGALGKSIKEFKAETSDDSTDATADDAASRPLTAQTSATREHHDEVLIGAGDRRERRDEVLVNAGERREHRGVRADEI
jgi:sec-independent protein translocase protein TatA